MGVLATRPWLGHVNTPGEACVTVTTEVTDGPTLAAVIAVEPTSKPAGVMVVDESVMTPPVIAVVLMPAVKVVPLLPVVQATSTMNPTRTTVKSNGIAGK